MNVAEVCSAQALPCNDSFVEGHLYTRVLLYNATRPGKYKMQAAFYLLLLLQSTRMQRRLKQCVARHCDKSVNLRAKGTGYFKAKAQQIR